MKRKERSRNLQTAERLCTLNEGEGRRGGVRKGGGRWPVSAVTELPRAPG